HSRRAASCGSRKLPASSDRQVHVGSVDARLPRREGRSRAVLPRSDRPQRRTPLLTVINRAPTLVAALLLTVTSAAADAPRQGSYGKFGIDLTTLDESIKPGDDFYRYAIGHWLQTNSIPSDRTRWGTMDQPSEDADARVRKLIQELPEHAPAGSIEQKVGDYYHAFVDE